MNDVIATSETRQIALDGTLHDIKLELTYWEALEDIADKEGMLIEDLLETLQREAARLFGKPVAMICGNVLRTAIYILVISYYRCATILHNAVEDDAGSDLAMPAVTVH